MKIAPISEADALAPGLYKRGLYDFEVIEASDAVSSTGNDMIALVQKVYDTEGKSRLMKDWLVESEGMAYKTRHFAAAVGMLPQYNKGELKAADLIGKTGRCQVGIETDKKGVYPDKNKIQDYMPTLSKGPLIASIPDPQMDDEIPF